jgi:hypothetical protein
MNKATRLFVSTFGAIMALAGFEHGIGEVIQGSVVPSGLMIQSWPESEFFRGLGGEPALTIIPNMLFTGVLAVVVSLALLLWSVLFVQRKNGAWIMIFLSIAMLLVGGGISPPIFGIMIGVVAARIHAPLSPSQGRWWSGFQRFLAKLWPFSYTACILAWLSVVPVAYFCGENNAVLILVVLFFSLATMVLTLVSGFAKDNQRHALAR